jgi:hypothetical protein
MDNDKTRYMFHVEQKGYNDDSCNYPDIILTQYVTFDSEARWPDAMRAFARFLSNVYGYDVEAEFNKTYVDPLTKWKDKEE